MIVQCKSGKANQRGPLVMWLNQPLYIPLEQILLRWATPRPMRILFESIPSPKDIRPHHLKHVSRDIMIHEPFRVMLFDLCKFEQHKSTHTREHFKTHCIKLKTFTFHLVSHRLIPLTKGQQRGKCFHFFHFMTLSWGIWPVQQRVNQLYFLHWNGNVIILIKFSSLTAPDVVKKKMTNCIAASDEKFINMMTSSNGNIFGVTGLLCGEFTGPRWIPRTKASDAELWCFFDLRWIRGLVNNREAGDLRRHQAHYDVIVIKWQHCRFGEI